MSQRAIRNMPMIITIMGHHGKEMPYRIYYQKLIKFIKFKCAVLTEVNAPYFRYVSKFNIFDFSRCAASIKIDASLKFNKSRKLFLI